MSAFNRRNGIVALAVAAVAAAALASAADPPTATGGAPPDVRRIEKFVHIAAFLNLAQGTVRMVAVLPIDGESSAAVLDTVAAVIRGNPSKRLRAYVVLRGSDSSLRAAVLAGRAADPRIVFFWDPAGTATAAWRADPARAGVWLYDTSARFTGGPPGASLVVGAPAATPEAPLAGPALREQAGELVRRVEAKMAQADDGS
ncbi:MAG TPA: hypothetical protein VEC56_10010 [Candidatus Krumholzibacteria bacterium]|nr:hypothetical protein [Candidatus Krumholzibacteria bacterium]